MRTTVKAPKKELVTECAVGEPLIMQTGLERDKRKLAQSPPAKLTPRTPAEGKKALRKR